MTIKTIFTYQPRRLIAPCTFWLPHIGFINELIWWRDVLPLSKYSTETNDYLNNLSYIPGNSKALVLFLTIQIEFSSSIYEN